MKGEATLQLLARGPGGVGRASADEIGFGPYRLEPRDRVLRKGDGRVALQPRPLAVLAYLAARAGQVVSRDELIANVWAGTFVTKAVLKVAVRAIREALADDAESPRYIETVGREGYRFIGGTGRTATASSTEAPAPIGRAHDLAALRHRFGQALAGSRQMIFVTGEAGIGKTTLLERFLEEVAQGREAVVGRGQCLEQYGEGEPYLAVLEAVGRLARDEDTQLRDVLERHAPTWVGHLPSLAPARRVRALRGGAVATMPARMLREMADTLEVYTRRRALILVLEDLQWSDRSTVDLLASLARRRQPARLLVIGTLRPADVAVQDHPLRALKQELQGNGECDELPLAPLSPGDVGAYLEARLGSGFVAESLAARIHERTDGNALFMVNVVNDLVAQGALAYRDGRWSVTSSLDRAMDRIPVGIQELIDRRLQALPLATRRALQVASVAGDEFTVAAVAAGTGDDAARVEDMCEGLAAQGALIADAGVAEWPDGSVSGRYRFRHALYRDVLYNGIGDARRVRLHLAIGLREEAAFGTRRSERAAELAMHFTRGRDHGRALEYHELAGFAALGRHAPHEAVGHLGAALAALEHEPDAVDRVARELVLVVARATLHMATRGYAAAETERDFARARRLCDGLPASPQRFPVLRGLVSYHQVRAELADAHALGERLLRHAGEQPAAHELRVQAHYGHGATLFHEGALALARTHLEAALAAFDAATQGDHVLVYGGYDPGVACSFWLAWTLILMGRLDEVEALERAGLARARRLGDAFSLAWAHQALGVSRQLVGDWSACEASSAEAVRLAEEHGFPYVRGVARVSQGWALLMQRNPADGIPILRDGVAAVDATGAALVRPSYLAMLAAADAIEGRPAAACEGFERALAEIDRTGEHIHEAGVLIGQSHLLSAGHGTASAAEASLLRALTAARAQGARLLELRAAVALARHAQRRRCTVDAHAILTEAHGHFADVRTVTPDIVAARALL
jgi:DNA-binding winged helix-turn-helix (wHTH) protein/tetratricopeptide (TPR) repeat protein